jgi:hypothetical protein
MTLHRRCLLWVIAAAASTFGACSARAAGWITLDASRCKPVDASAALPESWSKYRGSTRICALTRKQNQTAKVSLLSVFVDDYYLGLPKDAPWESFPLPMLVNSSGQCLAQLPHLFPSNPPSQLVIRAGGWKQDAPTLLRLDVLSPAVGGNYSLPSLKWDVQSKRYQPVPPTNLTTITQSTCP